MAKKLDAIYEPGELNRVRSKLGDIDQDEAMRMAQILGGEVGTEKTVDKPLPPKKTGRSRRETVEMALPGQKRSRPKHLIELPGEEEASSGGTVSPVVTVNPVDDPSVMLRTSYFERLKMDRYAAQPEFEIKNSLQVLVSLFSFTREPVDKVNPRFVNRQMNAYYNKIKLLVISTRGLLPRHNARRSERLKKASPFVYTILDTIRYWNIERIADDMAKIQAHPRSTRVSEFADILRAVYKPLFILQKLDLDIHIKGSYKLLYKLLCMENPPEPKEKHQELIRTALSAFADIRRQVHYGMHPLLMKLISDRWLPYEELFIERRQRFMAFLSVTEEEQIKPLSLSPEQVESGDLESLQEEGKETEDADKEDLSDPEVAAQKTQEAAAEAEQKVLDHGLKVLEMLFPKAGWERLPEYPDLYPYFANVFGLRHGYELIAPADPIHQVAILMHIMENLCVALRYVSFGLVNGADGSAIHVDETIGPIIANWRQYIETSFTKEYLPRLSDYCRMLEHSPDAKNSMYARRNINEIRWTKRLYFLPFYKFDSMGPPPFQNREVTPIYSQIKMLRKFLTIVGAGIEQGNRSGGAEANAHCHGIDNPWAQYHFEVPNSVSKRLNALLGPGKQNNAALIFFALSTATVLDILLNSESSWAYDDTIPNVVFRSVRGEGVTPLFGVDARIDADQIFKDTLKHKKEKQRKS